MAGERNRVKSCFFYLSVCSPVDLSPLRISIRAESSEASSGFNDISHTAIVGSRLKRGTTYAISNWIGQWSDPITSFKIFDDLTRFMNGSETQK